MNINNKNRISQSEYRHLMRIASAQQMRLQTRSARPLNTLIYVAVCLPIVIGITILCVTPKENNTLTTFAIRNGQKITNLKEAQQYANQTFSLLAETLSELNEQQ